MEQNEIVELALQNQEFMNSNSNPSLLAKIANFTSEEIEFVKLFWDPTFNDSWIYISKEMVLEWFGYKDAKNTMSDFYSKLAKDYKKNVDFKEVNQNDEIILKQCSGNLTNKTIPDSSGSGGHNKKYYLVNGECLKELLMSAQTARGKVVRKIYIKTEKLVLIMIKVVNKQQLIIKDLEILTKNKQIENSKLKELDLKSEIKNMEIYKPNGFVYLTTTKQYSQHNVFRLGKTVNLNQRMRNYELGRVANDCFYYVFVYECANVELLELILRRFLQKYKENADENKDMYILPFHILKPYVENICNIFDKNIITLTNEMIEINIDYIEANENNNDVAPVIEPFLFTRSKTDDETFYVPPVFYYEQIVELYKIYPGVEILTPKEEIHTVFCIVDIQCPHARKQIQVRALLNSLGCNDCIKDKTLADKEKLLLTIKVEDYSNYTIVELIDETTTEFAKLKIMERNRKITQNIIVNKYATENIKLLTPYKNFDSKISHLCEYGHTCTTSYNAFNRLTSEFCRTCRDLQREIKTAAIKTQVTEVELIKLATAMNWKHICKTGAEGIIEWTCPAGHSVQKVLRELKRGFCAECKI